MAAIDVVAAWLVGGQDLRVCVAPGACRPGQRAPFALLFRSERQARPVSAASSSLSLSRRPVGVMRVGRVLA